MSLAVKSVSTAEDDDPQTDGQRAGHLDVLDERRRLKREHVVARRQGRLVVQPKYSGRSR